MSLLHLPAAATAALLTIAGRTTPAAARFLVQPVGAYTLTTGRLWALAAALLGLAGVVVGGLALARAAGRIGAGTGRRGPSWPWRRG